MPQKTLRGLVQSLLFAFLALRGACLADDSGPGMVYYPEIIGSDEGTIQNAGAGAEIWHGGPDNGVADLVRYAVRVSDHAVNSMIRPSWAEYCLTRTRRRALWMRKRPRRTPIISAASRRPDDSSFKSWIPTIFCRPWP